MAISIQIFGEKEDSLIQKFSRDGEFNIASAYNLTRPEDVNSHTFLSNYIWKIDILSKSKHFLWLCFHNSVPVRQIIRSRGIICDTFCPLCKNQEESILHLLKDCPTMVNFWRRVRMPQTFTNFMHLDLLGWLEVNCLGSNQIQANGIPWSSLFPFAIWGLWKHRNNVVFQNSPINPSLHSSCIQQANEFFFCVGKMVEFQETYGHPVILA